MPGAGPWLDEIGTWKGVDICDLARDEAVRQDERRDDELAAIRKGDEAASALARIRTGVAS